MNTGVLSTLTCTLLPQTFGDDSQPYLRMMNKIDDTLLSQFGHQLQNPRQIS